MRILLFKLFVFSFISVCHSCKPGWLLHNGYCYKYKHEQFTFFEAKVTCDLLGGSLAVILSEGDNVFITGMISSHSGSYTWIALEDLDKEGQFVWYPSQNQPEYTNWLPSDPNDFVHNEDCVTTRPDGQWQDWDCETKHSLICQTENNEEIVG